MNIYDALNKLTWKKKDYFLWKHDLFVLRTEPMSEEELCKRLKVKTLSHMRKWEKTSEYLALVQLNIESQSAKDLEDIYKIVREKALDGDEKAIKMLLDLQKQARTFNKTVISSTNAAVQNDHNPYDELEL